MNYIPRDELLQTVHDDLEFLLDEWDAEVTDASLRRSSVTLRRLIVDGELQRAWKAANFDKAPLIPCSTLEQYLKSGFWRSIGFASAGGGEHREMQLRGTFFANFALSSEQIQQMAQRGPPEDILPLPTFTEAYCLIVDGFRIKRREVVKYVANKRGGAHFDLKRTGSDEDLAFKKLDQVSAGMIQADKDAVFYELLSIGQALARSDDITRLRARIGNQE